MHGLFIKKQQDENKHSSGAIDLYLIVQKRAIKAIILPFSWPFVLASSLLHVFCPFSEMSFDQTSAIYSIKADTCWGVIHKEQDLPASKGPLCSQSVISSSRRVLNSAPLAALSPSVAIKSTLIPSLRRCRPAGGEGRGSRSLGTGLHEYLAPEPRGAARPQTINWE